MLNVKQISSIRRIASENGFREYSFSVSPATKKGDNYMGNIFLITIRSANKSKNLILKCADSNLLLRKYIPLHLCYEREVFVYNTIIPCILNLQKDISLPHPAKVFTKIYDCSLDNLEEYLIFDDMKTIGYHIQDRKKAMDDPHVKIVIQELAKLHSFSFVLKHLKPELYRDFSTKLNDYLKVLLRTSKMENRIEHLLKRYANNTEFVKIMESCLKSSSEIFNNEGENWDLVIIHGDTWCNNLMFKYDWDPKVTTLPGLYLISSILLGPLNLCTIYWLRFISLLFSCLNLILFYFIFSIHLKKEWQNVLSAVTIVLLPPLYFFSHLYYTDIVSLTSNLLLILLSELGFHYFAAIAGFFSILCRQTNVIFLALYAGKYIVNELYAIWVKKYNFKYKKHGELPAKHFQTFVIDVIKNPMKLLKNMPLQFWINALSYISVLLSFIIFVLLNGSIVVGDKSAHQVSINIPQIFYFSLFSLIFGWPYFILELLNFLQFAKRHKFLLIFVTLVALLVVCFNTVVHPYLLADNRHLLFYVWNRFYGRYWWFRYCMVPVYIFSLYVIIKTAWNKSSISFFIMYVPAITFLLISQSLVELRYFFVPYIILRLRFSSKHFLLCVILEFLTYLLINAAQFNIFFSKTLYWPDMLYPQRIIW